MSNNIIEKIIVISGASDGLGLATAKALIKFNTVICLAPESEKEKMEMNKKYFDIDFEIADVTSDKDIDRAVKKIIKKYARIDILINNAGIWIEGKLEDNDFERIRKVLEVNILGVINLTQKVLPYMKDMRSGRIINIISQAGLYGKAERSVYHASKYAVKGFTESLMIEVAKYGVSVCGIYPDKMNTKFFEKAGNKKKDLDDYICVDETVRCIEFLVDTPNDINIPELGLKKLSQYC